MPLMAGQLTHELAVGQVPDPNHVVIAARRNERAIRADIHRSDPALVCFNRTNRLRSLRCGFPPTELSIATTTEHLGAVFGESDRLHPRVVTAGKVHMRAIGDIETH